MFWCSWAFKRHSHTHTNTAWMSYILSEIPIRKYSELNAATALHTSQGLPNPVKPPNLASLSAGLSSGACHLLSSENLSFLSQALTGMGSHSPLAIEVHILGLMVSELVLWLEVAGGPNCWAHLNWPVAPLLERVWLVCLPSLRWRSFFESWGVEVCAWISNFLLYRKGKLSCGVYRASVLCKWIMNAWSNRHLDWKSCLMSDWKLWTLIHNDCLSYYGVYLAINLLIIQVHLAYCAY